MADDRAAMNDWRTTLHQGLVHGDVHALADVPKTDLHCHALLSAPLATYATLLGTMPPPPPSVLGSFKAFIDYITTNLLPALTGVSAVRTLVRAALERMAGEGVVYTEMSFDLLIPDLVGIRLEEFAALVSQECERISDRLRVAPEIGVARGLPIDEVAPRVRQWIATGVWRSIDLYDDENLGALSDFAPVYRYARDHGLKLKAHAGELCGAAAVRDSVEQLELDAVQHGVRAVESPAVADFLAKRGTVLHVCPTSNYSLGVCTALELHPARRLFDHGVKITVNSDDFTLFGAGVSDELLNLTRMGFSPADIEQVVTNGLSQIPQDTRDPGDDSQS